VYRDADWGTPEPVIDGIEHQLHANGFRVCVQAHVPVNPRIDLRINIDGDDTGRVRYEGVATPHGDIDTNRTGLCLMHSLSAIGRPIEVLHDDGRRSLSTFPRRIAPWPPFTAVRAIRHEVADGVWASARFEGESFELEDQRNNADASFKTYGRSNFMPRPYRLRAGQSVRQAVELQLGHAVLGLPERVAARPAVVPATELRLGVGIEPSDAARATALQPWLRQLAPRHLHLRLDGTDAAAVDWVAIRHLLDAAGSRLRLDLTRVGEGNAQPALAHLATVLAAAGIAPESVTPFPSTPPVVDAARQAFCGCTIGGGTPDFFTQLNRLDGLGRIDHLTFCTSALVHGTDDESVISGLWSLPWMMETLASTHPGIPVHVGPSDIGARSSPLGAQPVSDGHRRLALARHDPRSRALFGAAWLLGYVGSCFAAGVGSISMSTLLGSSGLLRESAGQLLPCPAFFVVQALQQGRRWRTNDIAQLTCDETKLMLLANLSKQDVMVEQEVSSSRIELMDEFAWRRFESGAANRPWRSIRGDDAALRLPPLAIARLRRQ
jgi:hypothetical protein